MGKLYSLFIFSVLYWVSVCCDSANQCNPSLWNRPAVIDTLIISASSYCTNRQEGSAYCNSGWIWGAQMSGWSCLWNNNVAHGCPCWSTGCDGFAATSGACKCTMQSDPSQNYCFTTTQTCQACSAGKYLAGCGCAQAPGEDWICSAGTCTDLPSMSLISFESDGFRYPYPCGKGNPFLMLGSSLIFDYH